MRLADRRRQTGGGDQRLVEVEHLGGVQRPHRVVDRRIAEPCSGATRDETPTRCQEPGEVVGVDDGVPGAHRDRRPGVADGTGPAALHGGRDEIPDAGVAHIADAVRDAVGAASDESRKPAVDVEREEVHTATGPGAHVGAHVHLGEGPDMG